MSSNGINKTMKKKQYKRIALVLAFALLGIFVAQMDWLQVQANLQQVGWQFSIVFVITGIAYAMASTAWLLCFPTIPKQLSASKLFIYRQIGETLTTINPANIIVGESAKVYLLNKDGVNYEQGLVSILLSRILIFLSMIGLFLFLPIALYQTGLLVGISSAWLIGFTVFIGSILGIFYSMVHPDLLLYKGISSLNNKLQCSFIHKSLPRIQHINQLLYDFYQERKIQLFLAFLLSLFHWIMGAVEVFFLLQLLNLKITLFGALLIEVGVTCIKSIGAFIPGQIGVEECGNKVMLGVVGISTPSVWLTLSILRRTRQLLWLLIGGGFFLMVYNYSKA